MKHPDSRIPRTRVSRAAFLAGIVALTIAGTSLSGCSTRIRELRELAEAASAAHASTTWSLANGSSSIDLTATSRRDSTVHYAVFDADQGVLSADAVKAAAAACAGACKAGGTFSSDSSGATQSIAGLAEKVRYTVYAVAEDQVLGEDTDVQRYSGVLPRRFSMQSFATALVSEIGAGATVRYQVYVPPGYYDNPTATYPVLMYVHGGGERSNAAANTDADFALMAQTPFASFIAGGTDYEAIVVQPQCNEALWNCVDTRTSSYLAEVVDQVNATYRTNPKKFAVLGMSWGGSGALNLAYDYPTKISAVFAVAGALYTTALRPAAAVNLCPKFATNQVAIWAVNNVQDPWYNSAQVTASNGTYPGLIVSRITGNCAGYPDARFTELNDSTTFPMNFHGHLVLENVLASAYFDYGNCTGGNAYKSWNGATCTADSNPPAYRVPMHAQVAADLQTASTALTGSPTTFGSVVDWALHFTKP